MTLNERIRNRWHALAVLHGSITEAYRYERDKALYKCWHSDNADDIKHYANLANAYHVAYTWSLTN